VKNKFLLFFPFFFLVLPAFAFADLHFRFYPGLYLGADWGRPIDAGMVTIGADLQLGFEIGDFDYDDFVFAVLGNAGLDTGQPNEPNLYYGGTAEFYFWGDELKLGASLGCGWNTGISLDGSPVRDSFYIRAGVPVSLWGKMKFGLYFDFYPDIGSRLGMIFHF
jgi:hypothetical protein